MPPLPPDRDTPAQRDARAYQADPWVMYLVVRQDVPASADEVLVCAAQATARCAARYANSETWRDAFAEWSARSFRKVCLRAKGTAWEKLGPYDAGTARVRDTDLVRTLPPRRKSECDALLRALQVYDPDRATLVAANPSAGPAHADAMTFVVNPRASMSLGKQAAQVGHAVLMCAWSRLADDERFRDAFVRWEACDFPARIAPSSTWDTARARTDIVLVRDGGLTEVAPGTETVIALPPGASV